MSEQRKTVLLEVAAAAKHFLDHNGQVYEPDGSGKLNAAGKMIERLADAITSDATPAVNDEMVHAAFNVLFYAPADYPREIGRFENGFAAMRRALEAALEKR